MAQRWCGVDHTVGETEGSVLIVQTMVRLRETWLPDERAAILANGKKVMQ
jgi:hypothetical protein